MKNLKSTLGIVAIMFIALTMVSCKDANSNQNDAEKNQAEMSTDQDHTTMEHDTSEGHHDMSNEEMALNGNQDANAELILKDYFNLKDALVGDDNAKAKILGGNLQTSLGNFDMSKYTENQQKELTDILEDAIEHAKHISKNDIKHQREHFKILSKDITDMVAITGTANKLYEQFCPMYDGGSAWLSLKEEVRNPYYGSSMLKCGKVQREIN